MTELQLDHCERAPVRARILSPPIAATEHGLVGAIVDVMRNFWDLPADCNEGELFTYAEMLFDRIQAGDDKDALYRFLTEVEVDKWDMPASDAHREIVDRSVGLIGNAG